MHQLSFVVITDDTKLTPPYNASCPQNGQTHVKNLAANAARFLRRV